jgi:ssRNA-specific RNase YbeY (16S rRNA maturation enzyme)
MLSPAYTKIKELVLGKKYELSFAFVTPVQMRRAMKYKKEPAKKLSNVLAFPLSKTSGEILICKQAAKPYSLPYLFIHGCLHLKGLKHSATMERTELRLVKKFGFSVHEQTNSRH